VTPDLPALRTKARATFPSGHPVRVLLDNLPDELTAEEFSAIGPSVLALAAGGARPIDRMDRNDGRQG